ncbi:MAG: hypothetical protein ACRD1H_05535 [Vicinamibacterales bacterium]
MAIQDWLKPETQDPESERREAAKESILSAYLLMRMGVGILGTALPALLLLGDWFFANGTPTARGSLSAYYYSGMRDVLVGILFAVAPLLITYRLFGGGRDNIRSTIAGVAALGVALFPTGRPSGSTASLTALQDRLGEGTVELIHYGFAATFIGCLMIISLGFARGFAEQAKDQQTQPVDRTAHFSPRFWEWFHRLANVAIVAGVTFIIITEILDVLNGYALLIGESVVCIAFGASWLAKGMDFDVLRSRKRSMQAGSGQPAQNPMAAGR